MGTHPIFESDFDCLTDMKVTLRNLIIQARQEIVAIVLESTKSTRTFCGVLTFFTLLSMLTSSVDEVLGITPGKLIGSSFNIWTLVTHCFIENSLVMLIAGYTVILGSSRFLEPVWGQVEFSIFFGVVNVAAGLATALVYFFLYVGSFNINYLYNTHIHGLAGLKGGVFVALKQTRGEDNVLFGLKIKQIPMLYLLAISVAVFIGLVSLPYFLLLANGIFSAWVYLRFYQRHSRGRGDLAEHFSFASFFPRVFRGPIGFFSEMVYSILVRLKICSKATYQYDVAAPTNITISLPGTSEADAERRRKKALAVLSQKLKSVETQDEAWSDEDDKPSKEETTVTIDEPQNATHQAQAASVADE